MQTILINFFPILLMFKLHSNSVSSKASTNLLFWMQYNHIKSSSLPFYNIYRNGNFLIFYPFFKKFLRLACLKWVQIFEYSLFLEFVRRNFLNVIDCYLICSHPVSIFEICILEMHLVTMRLSSVSLVTFQCLEILVFFFPFTQCFSFIRQWK